MQSLNNPHLRKLVEARTPPCVSIYMPTHRYRTETSEDPIRFKNILNAVEEQMRRRTEIDPGEFLADLRALIGQPDFWAHQLDTLAIFKSPEMDLRLKLPRPLPEAFEVADTFHVKPLIRLYQTGGRYQVLCLTQSRVLLLEGDRDTLEPVQLHPMIPKTLVEALGGELDDFSMGGTGAAGSGGGSVGSTGAAGSSGGTRGGIFFGQHDNKDERDIDLERYFRAVDKAVWEHHSRFSKLPLYLATTSDYHDRFRKVSHNTQLQPDNLRLDAGLIRTEKVHEAVRPVVDKKYHAEVDELVEAFGTARAQNKGSSDLKDVAVAALDGRVMMLLIDADKKVGGKLDRLSRTVHLADRGDPVIDDLIDDVAETVLSTGGNVMVLPAHVMPADTGLAAMYRY